jgi:predicted transcriptional regulator
MEKREKRSFGEIRQEILSSLSKEKETINTISKKANTNWRTAENHLTYLSGRGLVNEAFSSEYVRIFEITDEGKEFLKKKNHVYDDKIAREVKTNSLDII